MIRESLVFITFVLILAGCGGGSGMRKEVLPPAANRCRSA